MRPLHLSKYTTRRFLSLTLVFSFCLLLLSALPAVVTVPAGAKDAEGNDIPQNPVAQVVPVIALGAAYRQTNFISDWPGVGLIQDPLLVNPWGISMRNTSPFWVANEGTRTSTLYRGDVGGSPLVKNTGLSGITFPSSLPTGTVGNTTSSFVLPGPCASPPCTAQFLFASLNGDILGWNSNAPATGSTTAVVAASDPTAVYTGLALATNGGTSRLYAADFKNGQIDVYDGNFTLTSVPGGFADGSITPGFSPYNIQAITIGSVTWLYVTYAKVGVGGRPEDGIGNGFVRRFDFDGVVDAGFAINNGALNTPWGLTRAPASFGIFGNALLVGNFGTGNPSIHAFDPNTGALLSALQNEAGQGIVINRLWALIFGNGGNGGDPNTLYFSAGIGEEEHGLFGKLQPTTAQATSLVQFGTATTSISEAGGHLDITVTRDGDTSGTATVNYATFDQSLSGHASQKTDYELAVGRLTFAPGETSKTFRILIVDDLFDENDEVIDLMLSNPTGTGVGLGSPNTAQVTILDNDTGAPASNPIDGAQFFVRQHYLDFYNREPEAGSTSLVNQITACGANAQCIYQKRVDVSNAFLSSNEFRETAFLDVFTHLAAYGTRPLYGQFQIGTQALQRGVVFGTPETAAQLEASKQAYFNEFVTRPEFVARYPASQTNTQFVEALLASAGLAPAQVRLFLVNLTNAQENPPATPTSSNGGGPRPASFGTARLQFNAAQTAMTFSSTVNNIDFTGFQTPGEANDNLTVAHIHAGPSVTPAVNGPVVWGFFGTPFNDNNPNDQVVTPFTSGVGGSVSGKWDAPEGNGTTLAAQLSNLREGRAYVNFHTAQFGGGEIRGNIPAATSLRDALIAGLNGGTETRATVLRKVAEQEELRLRETNGAVALVGFFEYFRRDPDQDSFNKLLDWLNSFNGDINRETARIFITSPEYRQRFGSDPPGLFANTAPDAVDDTALTAINTPISINVLANDTDFENVSLSISGVTPGTGGTPAIVGNRVLFTPAPNFTGTASFQYTITDNGTRPFDSVNPLPDPKSDTATVQVTVSQFLPSTIQLSAASYGAGEGDGRATLVVTRTIATAGATSRVDYVTSDSAGLNNCNVNTGDASARCDYTAVGGTLVFLPGETMKAITIPIINDVYVEGPEVLTFTLSNAGPDTLGAQSSASVTITDNDAAPGAPNPIDTRSFLVRQFYLDMLNREPDPPGLAAWLNRLNTCPQPGETIQNCDEIEVASAFFRSPEFFDRAYFIYKFYEAALGRQPQYDEYQRDLRRLTGFLTAEELEQRKQQFAEEFVNRAEFRSLYDSFGSGQPFVDAVLSRAGTARPGVGAATVVTSNRVSVINRMAASQITRAQGLRELMEAPEISQRFFNKAFVVVAYFAFLRRNPDIAYLQWINLLNTTGDYREMIRGFLQSAEYRFRFAPT